MANLVKIKKYLQTQSGLKLKGLAKPKEKTPELFLSEFFSNYNKKLETVYTSNGQIQTMPGKRRSIQDIYMIIYHYYPKASLTKLYNRLLLLIANDKVVSSICRDIHKRVYRAKLSDENGFLNGTLTDEFGVDLKTFKGEDKIGITTKCKHNISGWGTNYTREDLKTIEL